MKKTPIAAEIARLNLTQAEAAELLGVSPKSVTKYASGERTAPANFKEMLSLSAYPSRLVMVKRIRAKIAELEATLPKYAALEDAASITLYIAKFAELETMKNLLEK